MTKLNSYLEDLIEKSNLNEKDVHDIRTIFGAVTDEQKQNILDNWDALVSKLKQIEEDFIKEQEILLEKSLEGIDFAIKDINLTTHDELETLKSNM
ncbi:MAG: hypothetical protein N4A38_01845 [Candidatus Gracilibacteria bacterium]|nr:hypothetical protein [Candidatus Gracilibacteria bacterium]